MVEIEIVSVENIKPSELTPPHLRNFHLSLLDHLIPAPYAPIILFFNSRNYETDNDLTHKLLLNSLKRSLSETLTRFYPLAGSLGELSINCNDQGARFVEAKANTSLRDFLSEPDMNYSLRNLLPCDDLVVRNPLNDIVSNFQVSFFLGGGVSIGVCVSHKVLDGVALSSFLQSWSATSRQDPGDPIWPCLDMGSSLFPIKDNDHLSWMRDSSMNAFGSLFITEGRSVTKRLLFDATAISRLIESSPLETNPTRVEAVSAFLWKCAADQGRKKQKNPSLLATHAINLRRRTKPFLPENSIGNLFWIVPARRENNSDAAAGLGELAGLLRDSFSKVDDSFVKRLIGGDEKETGFMGKCLREIGNSSDDKNLVHVEFSSLCKFGFYEVDFGFGKPNWVSSYGTSESVFLNLVMLIDTKLGDGIEAWVTLEHSQMTFLENNPQLVNFGVLVDPIPF